MPRLLVVDTDAAFRDLVGRRLSRAYQISEADNPDDAVDLTLRVRPDCVLMDLMLPAPSGVELYITLRLLNLTQPTAIFITHSESPTTHQHMFSGIQLTNVFAKPIDFNLLRSRLDAAVRLKKPERRRETRVRLQVALKLYAIGVEGVGVELRATTDDVSANGFQCSLPHTLERDRALLVFCLAGGERFVGAARVVRTGNGDGAMLRHGFEFVEKPSEWIVP
jgi:DNA-binding response OmpR family regulator